MTSSTWLTGAATGALLLALAGPARAQDAGLAGVAEARSDATRPGVLIYDPLFFADIQPRTALDMVERLPAFGISNGSSNTRGLAGTSGNVLINGRHPSNKSEGVDTQLERIPAESVDYIEVITGGAPGILHGNKTFLLQDEDGQITEGHSISAGLDYPGIGPEHAWLKDIGRVEYTAVTDDEALEAFQLLCRTEGIIPALEPSHAIAAVAKRAKEMDKDAIILANLCGRGDKDIFAVAEKRGVEI